MPTLAITKKFDDEAKKFIKRNSILNKKLQKTLSYLAKNLSHPSLNFEKLYSNVWTVRIDRKNRIFLKLIDEKTILLLDVGPHDKYRVY